MLEKLIDLKKAADLVGVTAHNLRTWYEDGDLEVIKVGRSLRTTESKVQEAVAKRWRVSSCMVQTESMEPSPSHGCDDTSGTSHGTKDEGAESVARAASLATELAQKRPLADSSRHGHPLLYSAPVVRLK